MNTRGYMTDVAGHELTLLMQDTRAAIRGLDRQRESVLQAIEAAGIENTHAADASDETNMAVASLTERVSRLQKVLDDALRELDAMQAAQSAPASEELIAWPLWASAPARQQELACTSEDV